MDYPFAKLKVFEFFFGWGEGGMWKFTGVK